MIISAFSTRKFYRLSRWTTAIVSPVLHTFENSSTKFYDLPYEHRRKNWQTNFAQGLSLRVRATNRSLFSIEQFHHARLEFHQCLNVWNWGRAALFVYLFKKYQTPSPKRINKTKLETPGKSGIPKKWCPKTRCIISIALIKNHFPLTSRYNGRTKCAKGNRNNVLR